MEIDPSETALIGHWDVNAARVQEDETCKRIFALIHSYLNKITADETGWNTLYRDPHDGRYWQLTFPQGEVQGGGPPSFLHVSAEEVPAKFKTA